MRVAVIQADGHGYLEVVEEARAVPRLIRDVQANGRLSPESIDHVLDVLRDFQAVAHGAGAERTIAVATAAVRDADNSAELVQRVRDTLNLDLNIISGTEEARFAFLGAVHGLPVSRGMVVDVGGGSMEVVTFDDRRAQASWTLPLGAVRLTDQFLKDDPPTQQQVRALRKHVLLQIAKAGIPPIEEGGQLVGTGGTVRNLAKVDRARRTYPLPRLHGYTVSKPRLRAAGDLLRSRKLASRAAIPGLNEDRADTIIAGALTVQAVMDAVRATQIVVSGQGLREGAALATCADSLPEIAQVRGSVIGHTVSLFAAGRAPVAKRRAHIVDVLQQALGSVAGPEVGDALAAAAALLDVGRSIDYYGRHRHTESLLLARGLAGFTHREQALVCALARQAGQERYDPLAYRPLIGVEDRLAIAEASTLLAAADEVEQRIPPGNAVDLHCERAGDELTLTGDFPYHWDAASLQKRFARVFGVRLIIASRIESH